MRFADRFGLSMGPLTLRVLLAATFIWTGLAKLMTTTDVDPEQAARLAQMKIPVSVISPSAAPAVPTPATPLVLPDPATAVPPAADSTDTPEESPAGSGETETTSTPAPLQEVSWHTVSWGQNATDAQPLDFPEGGRIKSLYNIALLIDNAANPGLDDESNPIKPIWPAALATGTLPKSLAWVATLSEVGFGAFLLVGLLTRLSAFSIACVMGTASWLTVIGPAIQAGDPVLGFLPNHDPFDIPFWKTFAWQMSLFFAALAVLFMGSGAVALDRALFRRKPETRFEPSVHAEVREVDDTPAYDPNVNPFTKKPQGDES